jgi:hypothetical protein
MSERIAKFADELFSAVEGYLARSLSPLFKRLGELELREPLRGADGKDGRDGKDASPEAIAEAVQAAVAALPRPRDGVDGKSVDPAEVERLVHEAVDAIPKPLDGQPGQKGLDGRDGEPGEPGRDALQIDILETIDRTRSYPRGTYAKFNGGLLRALKSTEPLHEDGDVELAGWQIVLNPVVGITLAQSEDDPREFVFSSAKAVGRADQQHFRIPAQIYRDVYQQTRQYHEGDTVTYAGAMWHSNRDNVGELPKSSDAWTLCVKRGRDGANGERGEKGEKGDPGTPGRVGKDRLR